MTCTATPADLSPELRGLQRIRLQESPSTPSPLKRSALDQEEVQFVGERSWEQRDAELRAVAIDLESMDLKSPVRAKREPSPLTETPSSKAERICVDTQPQRARG